MFFLNCFAYNLSSYKRVRVIELRNKNPGKYKLRARAAKYKLGPGARARTGGQETQTHLVTKNFQVQIYLIKVLIQTTPKKEEHVSFVAHQIKNPTNI